MVAKLTDSNFQQEVIDEKGVVLVDFWAAWCGPCRMISPIIEQLAEEYQGQVKVAKLNVDENQHTASRYGIMSIPTLMIFKDGQVVDKIVGVQPKQVISDQLEQWLAQ
jgi:thioredoxin 1